MDDPDPPGRRPGDVTSLLLEWSNGDPRARDKLLPLVYDELRRLARQFMRHERSDHTLQATALVHEAFVRLVDQSRVEWRNSLHFQALAAQMMRRILVDHAREKGATKRGGEMKRLPLDESAELGTEANPDLLELDDALGELARSDPELSRVVELRFFGGLGNEAIAEVLGVSVPTVVRRWRLARAWLFDRMGGGGIPR
jgi:RNA polymerase sigma factor (TIGR02999 family)